ncbi:phage upper tail fiber protein [Angelakisella massiliensis]|nr:hypothetical protein [Angelakisella massiliensis]
MSENVGSVLHLRRSTVNPDGNIFTIKKLTRAQYDALSSKSSTTLYFIVG